MLANKSWRIRVGYMYIVVPWNIVYMIVKSHSLAYFSRYLFRRPHFFVENDILKIGKFGRSINLKVDLPINPWPIIPWVRLSLQN